MAVWISFVIKAKQFFLFSRKRKTKKNAKLYLRIIARSAYLFLRISGLVPVANRY